MPDTALTTAYTVDEYPEAAAAAVAAFQHFITAFNAFDEVAISKTMHYPHYRLKGGAVTVWRDAADYLSGAKVRIGPLWHRSVCDFSRPLAASADKVHLDVQWTRFNADDQPYLRFRALWVMALIDGRWAAQLRSSFEP